MKVVRRSLFTRAPVDIVDIPKAGENRLKNLVEMPVWPRAGPLISGTRLQ